MFSECGSFLKTVVLQDKALQLECVFMCLCVPVVSVVPGPLGAKQSVQQAS